ncbi:hypothetical protein GQ602_005906 [Ophiocordyceps camponoti-floridani]|uniref:Exoribonuclease phosphorolytic domain-containing protein n=1 Tax=Ophiocordyceps camponoti-floridani TaxID=2030778 RepID=A0A8H4VBI6_9HYPO|nr:hypothetical protein GQ602_005906 [Ophiocordyceps camponoti-floridani]
MPLDTSAYTLALLRVDGRRWNDLRRLHARLRTQDAADGSAYLEMGHTKVMCAVSGPAEQVRRGRNDRRIQEMEITVARTLSAAIHTHLFPHSTISLSLHVLSTDGSLLAALINASTLALIDAGVPMTDYVVACTSGTTSSSSFTTDTDPLLDLNAQEEMELPFVTVASVGEGDGVAALVSESRLQAG